MRSSDPFRSVGSRAGSESIYERSSRATVLTTYTVGHHSPNLHLACTAWVLADRESQVGGDFSSNPILHSRAVTAHGAFGLSGGGLLPTQAVPLQFFAHVSDRAYSTRFQALHA